MTKRPEKFPGGVKFLFLMFLTYLLLGLNNYPFALDTFKNFFQAFVKIFPFLLFVFFIIFIINLFLKPEAIKRHLGHNAGIKGWLYVSLGSIFITSPPYVTFPLLGELKKHGMRYTFIAVFLNSRNVQLAFLPIMAHYFGLLFTVVISIYVILYSILSGIILEKLMKQPLFKDPTEASGI